MSIIPAGKTKLQVNQGGFKNESIFDSELFKRFAATGTSVQPELSDPSNPSNPSGASSDLDAAMGQGANPSMRNDANPESVNPEPSNPELEDPNLSDKSKWKVNPVTGEPIGRGDFTNFFQKIRSQQAIWEKETGPLDISIKGNPQTWQITIQPQGKVTPSGRN